ncbi:MAG: hypothetical protein WAQ24_03780 [Candidatus Saccharimonadales bacterium]
MNASLPSSYDILRSAETEARFAEWEGNPSDAAHRREVASQFLLQIGVSPDWINMQWGKVALDLDQEFQKKSQGAL